MFTFYYYFRVGGRKLPIELVAKAAFEAFLKYDREADPSDRKLRDVRFVHKEDNFHEATRKKLIDCTLTCEKNGGS